MTSDEEFGSESSDEFDDEDDLDLSVEDDDVDDDEDVEIGAEGNRIVGGLP